MRCSRWYRVAGAGAALVLICITILLPIPIHSGSMPICFTHACFNRQHNITMRDEVPSPFALGAFVSDAGPRT